MTRWVFLTCSSTSGLHIRVWYSCGLRWNTWLETARLCSSRNGCRITPSLTGKVSRISDVEDGGDDDAAEDVVDAAEAGPDVRLEGVNAPGEPFTPGTAPDPGLGEPPPPSPLPVDPWSEAGEAKGTPMLEPLGPLPPTMPPLPAPPQELGPFGPLGVRGGVGFPGTGLWWKGMLMLVLLFPPPTLRGDVLGRSVWLLPPPPPPALLPLLLLLPLLPLLALLPPPKF